MDVRNDAPPRVDVSHFPELPEEVAEAPPSDGNSSRLCRSSVNSKRVKVGIQQCHGAGFNQHSPRL
jgi:hypothetical protein